MNFTFLHSQAIKMHKILSQIFEIENLCFEKPYTLNQLQSLWEKPFYCFYLLLENRTIFSFEHDYTNEKQITLKPIIGYSVFLESIDELELLRFAIHPSYQNQGLGTWFLSSIIDMYKTKGIFKKIFLEVSEKNQIAIRLYENLGFRLVAKRKNYYESSHALIMYLEL
ncbi:MAG: GNAT family N-acetyltransferase [Leptospiraceae bacterium]|nr:GNAT family N-acetyltransferase [Leptospiraceae bacterium]MDW7975368.1 GNAT family N-acetyltransferase [Leptospiraceae bacterium]